MNLKTRVGKWVVSTVSLGVPGLSYEYETMVFEAKNPEGTEIASGEDYDCMRYMEEADAIEGHENMIKEWMGRDDAT